MFSSINIFFQFCDVNALLERNIKGLVDKILSYHKQKPLRAFQDYKESSFQTAVELLLPRKLFISEMRLIMNYKSHSYEHSFADIFLSDNNYGYNAVLELKLFNLIIFLSGFVSIIDLTVTRYTISHEVSAALILLNNRIFTRY